MPAETRPHPPLPDAIAVLIRHAEGRQPHDSNGLCPDAIEGHDTRDPGCAVCGAIDTARATAEDAARYRQFFADGLPVCFRGVEYQDKASLDAAMDEARKDLT